jgi:hypothetical protein
MGRGVSLLARNQGTCGLRDCVIPAETRCRLHQHLPAHLLQRPPRPLPLDPASQPLTLSLHQVACALTQPSLLTPPEVTFHQSIPSLHIIGLSCSGPGIGLGLPAHHAHFTSRFDAQFDDLTPSKTACVELNACEAGPAGNPGLDRATKGQALDPAQPDRGGGHLKPCRSIPGPFDSGDPGTAAPGGNAATLQGVGPTSGPVSQPISARRLNRARQRTSALAPAKAPPHSPPALNRCWVARPVGPFGFATHHRSSDS